MATITIRNVPDTLVSRIKKRARQHGRSMESEIRELLRAEYASRSEALARIKARWDELPAVEAAKVRQWREENRRLGGL